MPLRSIRPILRSIVPGLLLGVTVACGQEVTPKQVDSRVEQRDSVGIAIIETSGAVAETSIGWTLAEVPELELGGPAGEGPEQFYRIGGLQRATAIAGDPDGRIVVLDAGSGELRFFDDEGRFLNLTGRLGDGPGEFRVPVLVPYVSNDSLLVFDQRLRRFTLLSHDGQAHRRFPLEDLSKGRVAGAALGASETGILMSRGVIASPVMDDKNHSTATDVVWINLDSGRDEIVARFQNLTYATMVNGIPVHIDVPFSTRGAAAIGPNGIFVTGGGAPEVREFDMEGRLIRIFRVAQVRRPVTLVDAESAIDYLSTYLPLSASEARRVYERMDVPEIWPFFQSIRVDRLGWIWAERFRPPQDKTQHWIVFDSMGAARGTLELPAGLDVHDIGIDYVLGRWKDDLGVEYVRRYRLDRRR